MPFTSCEHEFALTTSRQPKSRALHSSYIDHRPGGYLDPSETDAGGLATRLDEQLGVPKEHEGLGNQYHKGGDYAWTVKDCLSVWWRPNFDTFFVRRLKQAASLYQYPYLPPHVSEPKEIKKLYLVELPPTSAARPSLSQFDRD
jgi:hypothetical protein